MNADSAAAAVGVLAVLLGIAGLAGVFVPGLNATFAFVVAVGVLAGVQGLRYALARRHVDQRATDAGDPERRYRVPTPGDDLDREIERASTWSGPPASTHRPRLREAVVASLVLYDDCTPEEAERRVETGSWTRDPVAARYLGGDVPLSLSARLALLVRRQTTPTARSARTVTAIEAIRDADGRGDDPRGASPGDDPATASVTDDRMGMRR